MSARAEDAARALSREQPTTADAAVPAPANNGSADAEGVEIPAPEPSGNKNLLAASAATGWSRERARSAPSAPAGFCAEGIALHAKAFGSASPLQLAKVEVFYVGARCLTKSVHS